MMIGDAMTPFYPPFDPVLLSMLSNSKINSMLPSLFFEIRSHIIFDFKSLLKLPFSMFPYSILPTSI